jgi:dTDP-4-amino-4,6-dideoxygalactose transaminase
MNIPLYRHNLINENTEILGQQFSKLLSNMIISTGSVNTEVSKIFADFISRKYCLLTASWSAGMMATLLTLGIKPGDEIIVPAMTFVATASIVEALGAKAIFVDIDENTKLINFDKVLSAITKKTKAVIPVHLYGQMVDIKTLRDKLPNNIMIIEDAAHAIESSYKNSKPGEFSEAAIFSFYQSKNMTTGEGGAIVTDNEELYKKIKIAYRHGVDLCGYQRHLKNEFIPSTVVSNGIKANMPDLLAILLPPQIQKAKENIARRNILAKRYKEELPNFDFPVVDSNVTEHAWHTFAIGVDPNRRLGLLNYLHNAGIRSAIHFQSLHTTDHYKNKYNFDKNNFVNSYNWGERVLSLPLFPGLLDIEQEYVIKTIKDWIKNEEACSNNFC